MNIGQKKETKENRKLIGRRMCIRKIKIRKRIKKRIRVYFVVNNVLQLFTERIKKIQNTQCKFKNCKKIYRLEK